MALDWYPWYVVDYRRDTRHLTLAEHGAYRALIDEYMASGSPLPDSDRALSAIIGCGLNEWLAVAPAVRVFFEVSSKKLVHKRCEDELHAQSMLQEYRKQKAIHAAEVRWKNKRLDATGMPRAMLNNATLQDNKITTTEYVAASDLATALPSGRARSLAINGQAAIPVSEEADRLVREKVRRI